MRTVVAAVVLTAASACTRADEPKPAAPPPAAPADPTPALKVGDPAPQLAVTEWVKGGPVAAFAPGKVYVVDFWATWCGPCLASMPHLQQLVEEYKDKGLTAVAVTSQDPNNTLDQVKQFAAGRGAGYDFAVGFAATDALDKAWMQAAGRDGIPCSFVVGKDGKLAFVGHPLELDDVLPKVVDGTWRGADDVAAIEKMNDAFRAVLEKADADPKAALPDLEAFAKAYPHKGKSDQFAVAKMATLLRAGRADDAKPVADALFDKYVARKNASGLNTLRGVWASPELNPDRKHVGLAVAAAEAVLKVAGDADPGAWLGAAQAYQAAGDAAKRDAAIDKAVAAAPSDKAKEVVRQAAADIRGPADKK